MTGSGFLQLQAGQHQAVALMRHVFEESGDAHHGGGAGAGLGGDLAVGLALFVEQPRDGPAFGEGSQFRGGAEIGQEISSASNS
jgi:hypothetical protein